MKKDYLEHDKNPLLHYACKFLPIIGVLSFASFPAFADEEETTELEEVVVETQQKLVSSDGATLTYNVSDDPESGSSTLMEILRKVPGVTVDGEDNVLVNGQSSFQVLVNGRKDPMISGDLKLALKSLPAASIKKIEVISQPGAKYDAEGVGGILNFVTDRAKRIDGYLAQVGAWINPIHAGGYLYGKTRINKVMLDGRISYNNGDIWDRTDKSTQTVESLNGSENHLAVRKQNNHNGWTSKGINVNMSWEPDTLNLFTLALNCGRSTNTNHADATHIMYAPDLSTLWSLRQNFDAAKKYSAYNGQASYQHIFGREDHNLIASYYFAYGNDKNSGNHYTTAVEGDMMESPYSGYNSLTNNFYHIAQVDYSNKFNNCHLLEAGAKIQLNDNKNLSYSSYGSSREEAVKDKLSEVDMKQIMNIYAAYVAYTGSYSDWGVVGGLRYEHTDMGARYKTAGYSDYTVRLNDIVPNAAVTYKFSSASNLRLAYQMRISRPSLSQINPYIDDITPGWEYYGNPDLKSEKAHTFSLGYSNYEGKFSGSAKINYSLTDNAVSQMFFMVDGIGHQTYGNIGKHQNVDLELTGDWRILNNLRWYVYFSESYNHYRSKSELVSGVSKGWTTFVSTSINYTLPQKWRINCYGGFWTPWVGLQYRSNKNRYTYGLGISKSMLKNDALSFTLSMRNILPHHFTQAYTMTDTSMKMTQTNRYSQWNVGFSIDYKIGGLKAGVKKTGVNVAPESSTTGSIQN